MKKGDEFTCESCGGVFTTLWGDNEAKAEFAEEFPDLPPDTEQSVVCDDCFNELKRELGF